MGLMAMQMTGSGGLLSVSPEHLSGLVALVVFTPATWVALWGCRALAARGNASAAGLVQRFDDLSFTAKAALFGCLVGAAVHAAIIPTHWIDERVMALLFTADTVGFAFASWWTFTGRRRWRLVDAAVLGASVGGYALYILKGWESPDLVGLVTTTVELACALLVLSPAPAPTPAAASALCARPGGERLVGLTAVPLALLSLLGTTAIAGAAQASPATASSGTKTSPAAASGSTTPPPAMPGMASGAGGAAPPPNAATVLSLSTKSPAGPIVWPDDMAAMASGMAMVTPNCVAQATVAQQRSAVSLVNETVAAAATFESLAAAKAAGYVAVTPPGHKIVHYINPAIYRHGAVLDPRAIPALVYVNTPQGAVLSAAMYLAAGSGAPPQPGGCLTQWHIHSDLCFSGSSVVGHETSGPCPSGSVNRRRRR